MRICDKLDDEQNAFIKQLEDENIDPGYRQFLLFNLKGRESYKPHKKDMVSVEQICGENDDFAEVADRQYELFFERLKKYEKSYVLEGKINDAFVFVKYERESKVSKKHEPKCGRKMGKDIGRVDATADQSPELPNEQAPVDQHASDNVNDGRNEISKKKPDLRNKEIITESDVGFSKPLSKRMDNLGSSKVSKNLTFVQEINIVTDNQSEPHGQARLRKAGEGDDLAKAHNMPNSRSVIWISCDGNRYQTPDPRNNIDSKNQSEPVGQAQQIKRKKSLKGKNVVLSKHNPDTKNHLILKPVPKHDLATKYQVDRAKPFVPSERDKKIHCKTNLLKVMHKKNVVMDDFVASRKTLKYRDNEPLYLKPSPEKNLEEHQHEDVDQTQPVKKHKVQSQRKLRKMVHGSYEIKVDDAASRNIVAQIESKPLFHKPCSRNIRCQKMY